MTEARYHRVRGLEKGLAVLRAMNRLGEASAASVAGTTGLPRPTAHRLLETLLATGYVARGRVRGTYRLTPMVWSLTEGYRDDDWITDIADPVLRALGEEVVWPTDIATYDNGMMVVRTSTHHQSPLSLRRAIMGFRFPMLASSLGLAYLAFCPPTERAAILALLARSEGADGDRLRGRPSAARLLEETRKRGYGVRRGNAKVRTSSIAVPIMEGPRVLASLGLVWIDTAMSVEAAAERYLPLLSRAARRIEADHRRSRHGMAAEPAS